MPHAEFVNDENSKWGFFFSEKEFAAKSVNFSIHF